MKLLKFLFSVTIGLVYGLLFAQKSGRKFRQDLKKSKNPSMTFLKELWEVDTRAISEMTGWAKESENLQEVMQRGSDQFDALVNQAKTIGGDATKKAQEELETLVSNAEHAVNELKGKAEKEISSVKKVATKKVATAKKTATKKVKKVKKTATKKVAAVKKTATKKVAAAKKAVKKKV